MRRVSGEFRGSVEMTCASFGGSRMTGMWNMYDISVSAASLPRPTVEKLTVVEVETISAPLRRPPIPADLLQPFSHLQLASESPPSDSVLRVDLIVDRISTGVW